MSPCGGFVGEVDRFVARRAEDCGEREGGPVCQEKEAQAGFSL